ncbi:MAG: hypothetical protein IMZ53_12975 [Thermoplasmata archaeon]|nr:hypothetical protein [Thermoplasmata archaeon]
MSIKKSTGITFPTAVGTFTFATLTLSGITTTPALAATDGTERRLAVFFLADGTAYWGFISSWTTPSTLVFSAGAGLPTSDKTTVSSLLILDAGDSAHNYQDFSDELASLINDDAAKLTSADLKLILQKAATDWGKDEPLYVSKKITGNGTAYYTLATILSGLWKYGYSKFRAIEYPYNENPPEFLTQDAYRLYDDGTAQDGSNLKMMMVNDVPSVTDYFIAHFSIEPLLNESSINFPDTNENFSKVTTLAAAYACQRLATAYAQSTDASISADVVNYNDKSSKYMSLAKQYFSIYNKLVFGEESPVSVVKAAMSQKEVTPVSKTGDSGSSPTFLFHGRR